MEYCCYNCFENDYLRSYIIAQGETQNCNFCQTINDFCIETTLLKELFEPLVDLYCPVENSYPTALLSEMDVSDDLLYIMIADWGVFKDYEQALEILNSIFEYDPRDGDDSMMESAVTLDNIDRYADSFNIDEEPSENLDWDVFCHELKLKSRFWPSTFNKNAFINISEMHTVLIKHSLLFFRARIEEFQSFLPNEMGNPPPDKAKAGRTNAQGISHLYLSNTKATCVAEVRAKEFETISIGTFKVIGELKILDASAFELCPFKHRTKLREMLAAQNLLKGFANSLSLPVNVETSDIEYLPSQYVCDFMKSLGFDGIRYKSSQGPGLNLALFSSNKVKCIEVTGGLKSTSFFN